MGIKSEDTSPQMTAASSTASASRPSVARTPNEHEGEVEYRAFSVGGQWLCTKATLNESYLRAADMLMRFEGDSLSHIERRSTVYTILAETVAARIEKEGNQ